MRETVDVVLWGRYGEPGAVYNFEAMVVDLIQAEILDVGYGTCCGEDGHAAHCAVLCIRLNDVFAPASDSETVTVEDLPHLWEMVKSFGAVGAVKVAMQKRHTLPSPSWQDSVLSAGLWEPWMSDLRAER